MKISDILNHIDSGFMALPEFQRGYVWNRDQVRGLFDSLYRLGGISSEAEEAELEALNDWVAEHGLPRGQIAYDFADAESGEQKAVFDLAWPEGLQKELSEPVAVLLSEEAETVAIASQAGFRCFTEPSRFRSYVKKTILAEEAG